MLSALNKKSYQVHSIGIGHGTSLCKEIYLSYMKADVLCFLIMLRTDYKPLLSAKAAVDGSYFL